MSTARNIITIIAPTVEAAMRQFHERGLAAEGYSIYSPIERHEFSVVSQEGSDALFAGEKMFAATFTRGGTASPR
jgi:hypothetical protein